MEITAIMFTLRRSIGFAPIHQQLGTFCKTTGIISTCCLPCAEASIKILCTYSALFWVAVRFLGWQGFTHRLVWARNSSAPLPFGVVMIIWRLLENRTGMHGITWRQSCTDGCLARVAWSTDDGAVKLIMSRGHSLITLIIIGVAVVNTGAPSSFQFDEHTVVELQRAADIGTGNCRF